MGLLGSQQEIGWPSQKGDKKEKQGDHEFEPSLGDLVKHFQKKKKKAIDVAWCKTLNSMPSTSKNTQRRICNSHGQSQGKPNKEVWSRVCSFYCLKPGEQDLCQ